MITTKLHIILFFVLVSYFVVLFRLLVTKQLLLKYSLIWIAMGVALSVFVINPRLITYFANLIGIYLDINFLFLIMIGVAICIIMSLTVVVSRMSERNKKLIQAIALLENRVQMIENQIRRL